MKSISVMIKPASGTCNMSCDYCFYCDEAQKRKQESYGFMSEETLKNVIRRTLPVAEESVCYAFQGGEPTLRGLAFFEKVTELQQKYNKNNVIIYNSLQTNGYAIDEDWCRFLKKNHFLVGISLDGIRTTHDRFRHTLAGGPTFQRVLKTIELFDRYGIEYNILTVVNRHVAAHIEEIYEFYKKKGWHYQQYIACMDPLQEAHGNTEYALRPEEYGQFLITLFRLWHRDYLRGQQPYIRQFENYAAILMGYLPEACEHRGVCSEQYVAEADGSVYPCDFYALESYQLGNFNTDRLEQLDAKRNEIGFITPSLQLTDNCRTCSYHHLCRGGCRRNRDLTEDGFYQNYFCRGYQMFFRECYSQLKEIAAAGT